MSRETRWATLLVVLSTIGLAQTDSRWFLPSGFRIKAVLDKAIYSHFTGTSSSVVLTEQAECPRNGNVVLPKGTKLIGSVVENKKGDEGWINIKFHRAYPPTGMRPWVDIHAVTRFRMVGPILGAFIPAVREGIFCDVYLTSKIVLEE